MQCARHAWLLLVLAILVPVAGAADANRLTYLDEPCDPYYPGLQVARLVTPQWIGEEGVEAAVVLSVDDLVDTAAYEKFLRPILQRLQKIDGRAPVSLMAKHVEANDPLLQVWLREGLSLEAHTYDHPCPCLQQDDFDRAKQTYDHSVDVMQRIPGSRAVAYRMPCCDSMNSASPRFYAEIFNKVTPLGNWLGLDSSIFALLTKDDPVLPPSLALEDGRSRFDKYIAHERGYVNYVENYPYPFVIGRLCWELPASVPGDWQGFNIHGRCSPATVGDMKASIDAAVLKQGVFVLCFHPHNWIRNDQVIELIDHVTARYGSKVKFLTFREVYQRLTRNLLAGHALRAADGQDNGVRVLDLDGDGFMDVAIGNERVRQTRIWSPASRSWTTSEFPAPIVWRDAAGNRGDAGVRFGVLDRSGRASLLVRNEQQAGVWHLHGRQWVRDPQGLSGLEADGPVATASAGGDCGVRLRDVDQDGVCELIVGNDRQRAVLAWSPGRGWSRLPFALPEGTRIVRAEGRDAGLRFVDVNQDGRADVVFSDPQAYSVHLFVSMKEGLSRQAVAGRRGGGSQGLPPIVRADGTNNGVWFKYGSMWAQNENTSRRLPGKPTHADFQNLVQRVPYNQLAGLAPPGEAGGRKNESDLGGGEPIILYEALLQAGHGWQFMNRTAAIVVLGAALSLAGCAAQSPASPIPWWLGYPVSVLSPNSLEAEAWRDQRAASRPVLPRPIGGGTEP